MPFEVDQVNETTWVRPSNIRTAGLMSNAEAITTVLKEKGLERARIGAELGREQYLGINYKDFTAVGQALPQAELRDAAPLLLKLRSVKSAMEIAYMRQAAEITAQAEDEAFNQAQVGMTELEVARLLRTLLAEAGGERVTFMIVSAGATSSGGMVSVATERRLEPGQTLVLDTAVEVCGYCSDVARTAFIGEPTFEASEFYRWLMYVRQCGIDELRAGNTPLTVVTAVRQAIAQSGLKTLGVGRIGHGVGLETTEYPSLAAEENLTLEPGMVFTCNPNFVRPFGFVNAEDIWLITGGAPELLSAPIAPNELRAIGRTSHR
jgi:Xaa-Pro aminopeptidase